MVTLKDIQAARTRISPHVRRTPMLHPEPMTDIPFAHGTLTLKLECLQATGSFKVRGAMNKLLSMPEESLKRGIVAASAGNHGSAVAYVGWRAKIPTTIYLPENTPTAKLDKMRKWGANIVLVGEVWDDANAAALKAVEHDGAAYFHPFADPNVIAGQGTTLLEILEDAPDTDTIVVAIGGGGLIAGVAIAAKAINPSMRIIGVEPTGAPTLHHSIQAGHLVELSEVHTRAGTLSPRLSAPINYDIIRDLVDEIVLVSDEEMLEAARWLWFETSVAAELSGSAALAAFTTGKFDVPDGANVCVLVCGAGTDGIPGISNGH